jgi:hypothetical protein
VATFLENFPNFKNISMDIYQPEVDEFGYSKLDRSAGPPSDDDDDDELVTATEGTISFEILSLTLNLFFKGDMDDENSGGSTSQISKSSEARDSFMKTPRLY